MCHFQQRAYNLLARAIVRTCFIPSRHSPKRNACRFFTFIRNEKMSNQLDNAWCIYTYIKDRDFLSVSRVYTVGYTFFGPVSVPPQRRPGDVLFDGVSKREILTEQLSAAGIMWADGWREIRLPWNFRRTRYCSERERWR